MSRRRVYLCVILEPMDQETVERLVEELTKLEHNDGG